MPWFRAGFSAPVTLIVMAVSACGGGGGGGGGSTALNYTLSQSSATSGDDTSDGTFKTVTINYTVNNWNSLPLPSNPIPQVSWTGTAISFASVSAEPIFPPPANSDTTTGIITITFWPAALLGAGVYSGSVIFTFCTNESGSTCLSQLAGPPTTIPVTFTVTGAARPTTTAAGVPAELEAEGASADAAGPTSNIYLALSQVSPGPFVTFTQPANGFVAGAAYTDTGAPNGVIALTYVRPGLLPLGAHSESFVLNICIDPLCAHPLANSPFTIALTYNVTATAGVDYTVRSIGIFANDIAWVASSQKIYAVVSGQSSLNPRTLTEIDPQNAVITRSLALNGEPSVIAVSDDGSYAYIGFSDQNIVQRVALTPLTQDITINLGSDPIKGNFYAGYLAVVPGQAHSVAISTYANAATISDNASEGVFLYDDLVPRPASFGAMNHGQQVNSLTWGASSSTLYAFEPNLMDLFTVAASASGLTQSNEIQNVPIFGNIQFSGGLIYGQTGLVMNPASGTAIGNFLAPQASGQPTFAIDATLNRAYFFFDNFITPTSLWTLESFNLSDMTPIAESRVNTFFSSPGGLNGSLGHLIRWGTNGLAINAQQGLEIISGAFVTL